MEKPRNRGGAPKLAPGQKDGRSRNGAPRGKASFVPDHGCGQIGNPPHIPTDAMRLQVRTLAKVVTQRMAAISLGISENTLKKYYAEEWDAGSVEVIATVGGMLLKRALDGDPTAQMFILNTRGKEAYSRRTEVTGKDGGAIETIDLSKMTPEQLDDYERLCRATLGIGPDDEIPSVQ
jgi:hypothetical protein